MGSIGDTFPYAAPVNGTAGWANWIAVTDELITRVSSPVPISALSGSTLPMDGNEITHVKDIVFDDQTSIPTTTPGGMYYYGGEWYLVTVTGAIQVTTGGLLNVTVNGGISGDYGGGNPASVRFVDADSRYDFYDNYSTTAWAYVKSKGLDITGVADPTKRGRLLYDGVANLTFTLPTTLPAANTSLVQISSAGTFNHNSNAVPVSNTLYLGANVDISANGRNIIYGRAFSSTAVSIPSGAGYAVNTVYGVLYNGSIGDTAQCPVQNLPAGGTLTSVELAVYKGAAVLSTYTLYKSVYYAAPVSIGSTTTSASGNQVVTITPGATVTITAGTTYYIEHVTPTVNDKILTIVAVYNP